MIPLRRRGHALEEWDRPGPSRVRTAQRVRTGPTLQRVKLKDALHPPLVSPAGVWDWYHDADLILDTIAWQRAWPDLFEQAGQARMVRR